MIDVHIADAGLADCPSTGCQMDNDINALFGTILAIIVVTIVVVVALAVWHGVSAHTVAAINRSDISEGSRAGWKIVVVGVPYLGAAVYWWGCRLCSRATSQSAVSPQ